MSVVASRVQQFLDQHYICYETVPHLTDFTAMETSEHTHTPGRALAKAVVIRTDRQQLMLVLPADHRIEFDEVSRALNTECARLVKERSLKKIFSDCDCGAIPPFGNLYQLEVFICPDLLENQRITFNAGSHQMAIRMSMRDYQQLVSPLVLQFSQHM